MGTIVQLAASIVIDTSETLTVNKTNLASKIGALGDTYFNNQSNWSSIEVEYRSTTGNQREIVKIDPSGSTGTFAVVNTARLEGWSLRSIRVKDFNGDSFTVKRADLVLNTEYEDTTISGGVAVSLIDHYTGIDESLIEALGAGSKLIQSFTPTQNMTISDIDIVLLNQNLGGNFEITIGTAWDLGVIMTSDSTPIVANGGGALPVNVVFSAVTPPTLSSGVKYYLTIQSVSLASVGPTPQWGFYGEGVGTYTGGGVVSQGGPTPAGNDQTYDLRFKIQGSLI